MINLLRISLERQIFGNNSYILHQYTFIYVNIIFKIASNSGIKISLGTLASYLFFKGKAR